MTLDPELSTSLMGTTIMVTLSFSISLLGTITTSKVAEVAETAYNSQWYQYPIGLRKNILPLVQNAHEPINFHGYHVVLCTLEVFMKVIFNRYTYIFFHVRLHRSVVIFQFIRSAFSYYIMVRQISQRQ